MRSGRIAARSPTAQEQAGPGLDELGVGQSWLTQHKTLRLDGGLRRKVEAAMLPEEVIVMLNLDKAARLERDRRRLTGRPRPGFAGTSA